MRDERRRDRRRAAMGWWPAALLALLPGCTEYSCIDLACAPRTEIYFAVPIREAGDYTIEGTGTGGVAIECTFSVARSGSGGILVDESVCGGFLPFEWPDAGNRPQLDGVVIPARISSALLVVRRDGVTLYDGQATLDRVLPNGRVCDCDTPVLIAQ